MQQRIPREHAAAHEGAIRRVQKRGDAEDAARVGQLLRGVRDALVQGVGILLRARESAAAVALFLAELLACERRETCEMMAIRAEGQSGWHPSWS